MCCHWARSWEGADLLASLAYKPVRVKCQGTWTMIFVEMPALLPRAVWSYLAASLEFSPVEEASASPGCCGVSMVPGV